MTDDEPTQPEIPEISSSNGAPPRNGNSRPAAATVRSGLAQRRNPVLATAGEFVSTARRLAFKDPLSLFLLLASIGLAIAFSSLLGAIKPSSSGTQTPISVVQTLAKHKEIANATLLDHDSRVELTTASTAPTVLADGSIAGTTGEATADATTGGATTTSAAPASGSQKLWTAYPASGALTQQLLKELDNSGAIVSVDQQTGKPTKAIVVQFLIPILLLVCLFSLFMRVGADGGAGGIAGFSQFTGKGKKKGKGSRDSITSRNRQDAARQGGRR
jgi:cell division protease FtsH